MEDKRIYRVHAHDTTETDYPCTDAFYVTDLAKAEFALDLEEAHEGTIVIDEIIEYSLEEVINLLNLYIE